MGFYHQIKLINYIRRQMHNNSCMVCDDSFPCRSDVLHHMISSAHNHIPPEDVWNQPQYFFPTYEDDALLCVLTADDTLCSDGTATKTIVDDVKCEAGNIEDPP